MLLMQVEDGADIGSSQAFFFDNIRSENNEARLSAINLLKSIAKRLGPDETLETIFPLIQELTKEVDEDIRFALLDQLNDFLELIGNSQIEKLLEIFEIFLASDDAVIRNKAAAVVLDTVSKLPRATLSEIFVPFVVKMLDNELFTARLSGVVLWPTAYECDDENQQQVLLQKLIALSDDQIMTVRRLFASNLPTVLKVMKKQDFISQIFPIAIDLLSNSNDTIKISAIDSMVSILPDLQDYSMEYMDVIKSLRNLALDKSWRVRYSLVLKYPELKNLVKDKEILKGLLDDIDSLLDDREAEVRSAAASVMSNMFDENEGQYIEQFFTQKMWDRIDNLISGGDSDIGSTLVEQIGKLSKFFSSLQYKEFFIPFLDRVLKNSNPEVKLKGLSILTQVPPEWNVLREDLVGLLKDMSTSQFWRIRLSLVEHISEIAPSIVFDNNEAEWTEWCNDMLEDDANAVRESTVVTVVELMKKLGDEWVTKFINERIKFYYECDRYLLKITTIYLFKNLCKESESRAVQDILIQNLISFAADKIANVKINIARVLGELFQTVSESSFAHEAESLLVKLSNEDSDPDVTYFAKQSLKRYQNV